MEKWFDRLEEALEDLRQGKMIVVVDDEDRENEGDLVVAAEKITPESVNFMATHGRGLICLAITEQRANELNLTLMVPYCTDTRETAFTVSVDHKNTTTGISAFERAYTIKAILDPSARPEDLRRPGHIFPLRAREGGVLRRAGHTEAAVDLARLAGLYPAGVICEIMREDGHMARVPDLRIFCRKHGLKMITIAGLIQYRRRTEELVRRVDTASLPTKYGEFTAVAYQSLLDGGEHLALIKGDPGAVETPLVRVHSECLTGDVFNSRRCSCRAKLEQALKMIACEGAGVFLYLRDGEKNEYFRNKIAAYRLQDLGQNQGKTKGKPGLLPELRDYGIGAQILVELGLRKIRVLTNNPRKVAGLAGYGLQIVDQIPLRVMETEPEKMLVARQNG